MTLEDESTSTTHYERQAASIRHSLANAIDELNQRLTPGQVFDEVWAYAKDGGGTFLKAFSNAARRNPVPSLLIGTGCMLFLSEKMSFPRVSGYREGHRDNGRPRDFGNGHSKTEIVAEESGTLGESVKQTLDAVGESIGSASQKMREKSHEAKDKVAGAIDQAKEGAHVFGDSVTEKAAQARQQAADTARQVKDRALGLVHEQPLLVAGIGLALGAALAAWLPSTRMENELLGETSDNLKKSLGNAASEQLEAAKATAGRVAEGAMRVVEREGVTASGAAAKLRDLGETFTGPGEA